MMMHKLLPTKKIMHNLKVSKNTHATENCSPLLHPLRKIKITAPPKQQSQPRVKVHWGKVDSEMYKSSSKILKYKTLAKKSGQ